MSDEHLHDDHTTEQPSATSPRAMIAVSQLAAHPGNVRADLDLKEDFVASIAANGVLVALRITPDGVRVPGHRRRPPPGRRPPGRGRGGAVRPGR
jgi:hypothetical protein